MPRCAEPTCCCKVYDREPEPEPEPVIITVTRYQIVITREEYALLVPP